MAAKERLRPLFTGRGIVVALVAVAVVGAGLGFVSSAPNDATDDSGDAESLRSGTTTLADERTAGETQGEITTSVTEPGPEEDDATSRTRTTSEETTTPIRSTTRTAADSSDADPSDADSDGWDGDGDTDDQADVSLQLEGNATVGSLDAHPTSSLRLNAVANAPTTASTAGGA